MSKTLTALIIVLSINLFLFLGQYSSLMIAQDNDLTGYEQRYFNYENSTLYKNYNEGGFVLPDDIQNELPGMESDVQNIDGNFFTDIFKSIKNWFLEATGAKYLTAIVSAFPSFLKILGLPPAIAWSIGAFWHAIGVFLIVIFIRGG